MQRMDGEKQQSLVEEKSFCGPQWRHKTNRGSYMHTHTQGKFLLIRLSKQILHLLPC